MANQSEKRVLKFELIDTMQWEKLIFWAEYYLLLPIDNLERMYENEEINLNLGSAHA